MTPLPGVDDLYPDDPPAPGPSDVNAVRVWMRRAIEEDEAGELLDCGELNCTKLAEECAQSLGLYLTDHESTIPGWLFDLPERELRRMWRERQDLSSS